MKFVIAPDSFKECLSAHQVAESIKQGILSALPSAQCILIPMADGGEGTSDALVNALNGRWITVEVQDPLGRPTQARYGILPDGSAVMEMAQAAGIHLVAQEERNPLITSTYGVGEMIKHALKQGVHHIILGIGGSATNDAGAGMLQALGCSFKDADGKELTQGGLALSRLHSIDTSQLLPELAHCTIEVACDVNNPLCGTQGASAVFGPQKGATPEIVQQLDQALTHYANIVQQHGFTDARHQSGSGAAGGLGFALRVFLNATLKSGVEIVMHANQLSQHIQNADWVITGEGKMDGQTACGKVPMGVLSLAQQHQKPVIALCGVLGEHFETLNQVGFHAIFPILPSAQSQAELLANGANNLRRTAQQIAKLLHHNTH